MSRRPRPANCAECRAIRCRRAGSFIRCSHRISRLLWPVRTSNAVARSFGGSRSTNPSGTSGLSPVRASIRAARCSRVCLRIAVRASNKRPHAKCTDEPPAIGRTGEILPAGLNRRKPNRLKKVLCFRPPTGRSLSLPQELGDYAWRSVALPLSAPALALRTDQPFPAWTREQSVGATLASLGYVAVFGRLAGALGEIRTPGPRNRNPMLYPAELRAHQCFQCVSAGF